MSLFEILAVLITLSALFSYVNYRYFRLPTTIGVMLIALVFSLVLILASYVGWELERLAEDLLMQIDFNQALLHGMLSFLLFAGALHVNLGDLAEQKWIISALATVGVLGCTGLIGLLSWTLFNWLGLEVRWIDCLLFGALISPTDPIAVMGILRRSTIPRSLVTKITGESLFNDGVAVVVFLVLLDVTTSPHGARFDRVLGLLVLETGGGDSLRAPDRLAGLPDAQECGSVSGGGAGDAGAGHGRLRAGRVAAPFGSHLHRGGWPADRQLRPSASHVGPDLWSSGHLLGAGR